jgi:hypothetical protein
MSSGDFIDSYVNVAASDERLHAFMRVHVLGIANDTDDKGCGLCRWSF